jgi:hypothetical protein
MFELGAIVGFLLSSTGTSTVTVWKEVPVLKIHALLFVQDHDLSAIDLSARSDAPAQVFRLFPDKRGHNSQIARRADEGSVLFTNGRTILSASAQGRTSTIASLDSVITDNGSIAKTEINWLLKTGPTGLIYFCLLGRGEPRHSFVAKLDPQTLRLDTIEVLFPSGIDVDTGRQIVYKPEAHAGQWIEAARFGDESRRKMMVTANYSSVSLDPKGTRLVMSGSSLDVRPKIALLDISTGRETSLPATGSDAVWLSANTIAFVRGESELWSYRLGDNEPKLLFAIESERAMKDGSNAKPPILSGDGRALAWGWAAGTRTKSRLGTIVVDLERGEYRRIHGWWHNMQLLRRVPSDRRSVPLQPPSPPAPP